MGKKRSNMYVTRYLSHYIRHPESLSTPPEGPNSGYLVLQDEDSETITCFGFCKSRYLIGLPFPQNKDLTLRYSSGSSEHRQVSHDDAVFIPVLNQPLSSNLYYAIKPHGSHKGEAYACSREEDASMTCCSCCIKDEHPRPLDPNDVYQQFQVSPYKTFFNSGGSFTAHSIAPDGIPPYFLRRKGWEIYGKMPKKYELGDALGVNSTLRSQLPKLDLQKNSSPVVVGKWYCPFMFIKDGILKDQINRSMYFEMTLEQRWEQILESEEVETETVFVGGKQAVWDEKNIINGVIWFVSTNDVEQQKIGLSSVIIERMKWEVTRFGWVKGEKRRARVERKEKFSSVVGDSSRVGCYILVERFNLKRMDGSVALAYDFKHTQLVRSK